MVNNGSSIEVYCTRPNCNNPHNSIPEESLTSSSRTEIRCSCCGMPLILQGHFVPLRLLIPDEERGGFGRTFLAEDINFPHKPLRVIKQLHPRNPPGRVLSPSELQRIEKFFQDEASILAELRHQQIPSAWDFFVVEVKEETGSLQRIFYLVQDYIEGHNLAQELRQGRQFSEDEVFNILQEILKILDYIHNYDGTRIVIHRDIKPSNIMRRTRDGKLYLIDFGTVKQVVIEGLPVNESTILGTPDFAPPEQFAGKKVSAASDLYSLAATCVCLLTGGRNPRELLLNSNWRQHTNVSNKRFANVLDSMLKYRQEERPQSAKEVLDALASETQYPTVLDNFLHRLKKIPRRWRWRIGLVSLALLTVAIAVTISSQFKSKSPVTTGQTTPATLTPTPATPLPPFAEYFSRGEEALLLPNTAAIDENQECKEAYESRKRGIEAFARKDFQEAENNFNIAKLRFQLAAQQTAFSQNKCDIDPETWIYHYNSKVAQTELARNGNLPTIAVVIPGQSTRSIAVEILQGIAQALNPDQPLFQILISKDNNNTRDVVQEVATYISKNDIPGDSYFNQSKILGVIGHYSSINTWKAGKIYGADALDDTKKLVFIAPTSTAIRKPDFSSQLNNLNTYVFRTGSNDSIAANDLADYMWDRLGLRKALIAYEPDESYSKSLRKEFTDKLIFKQVNPNNHIQYCNLQTDKPEICIQIAKNVNAQALILAPSRRTLEQARKIIKLGNQQFQILAGDVLYDQETLNLKDAAKGMVVAVFSHPDLANDNFKQKATEIGWIRNITWRTITSYDAAQAFIKALNDLKNQGINNPSRQDVYRRLNDATFSTPGATGNVEFNNQGQNDEHDRKPVKGVGVLVQVNKNSANNDAYSFTLLQPLPNR
ncbi:serine/threonine protein kinase [Nostoc sp. NIES-4103]|nr:serine/threonine protein kinase [Nostoc sp. NIES-4103]